LLLAAALWARAGAATPRSSLRTPSQHAGPSPASTLGLSAISLGRDADIIIPTKPAASPVDLDKGVLADLSWPKVAAAGAAVGAVFGAMGAGASMIMKPLLYYVFDQRPFKRTIFEMYLILIILSSLGAARGHAKRRVAWDHVLVVAICTSGAGASAGALLARLVSSHVQLVFFGFLVLVVAAHMWQQAAREAGSSKDQTKAALESDLGSRWRPITAMDTKELVQNCVAASVIGLLSGFVGVGGGFMLTPLLCHMGHQMDTAVPTSLAVIALTGGAGGFWYAHLFGFSLASVNVPLVLSLAAAGCTGLLLSEQIASLLPKAARQRCFALLLICIGVSVVLLELVAPIQRQEG